MIIINLGVCWVCKFAAANHFADDICIIYPSKKLKALESDLKLCSEWLNDNILPLNVDKTKLLLLLFHGPKLNPSDHVKYLGIF